MNQPGGMFYKPGCAQRLGVPKDRMPDATLRQHGDQHNTSPR